MKKSLFVLILSISCSSTLLQAQFTILHDFEFTTTNGSNPRGSLITDGTYFYGMTVSGGTNNYGVIFMIEVDGTDFTILHNFAYGVTTNGYAQYGDLLLIGSDLYGMTRMGGANDWGTIFKIGTDGNGFTILHSFAYNSSNGLEPYGSLINIGTDLYGMTRYGGTNQDGIIFSISTSGTGFTILHNFAESTAANGDEPCYSKLNTDGSYLYGMTLYGGANYDGTIFRIEIDGSNFTILHSFAESTITNGEQPYGSLISDGTYFYGMTRYGGLNDEGTIFRIEIDGSNFTILHSFSTATTEGENPYGSLARNRSILYGMTNLGGANDDGIVFKIGIDGSDFTLLHSFAASITTNGNDAYGTLIYIGLKLFGMTNEGGANDNGTIFSLGESSLPVELSSFTVETSIQGVLCEWTTESETENLGFILERKTDGKGWTELASYKTDENLLGQGSTSSSTNYEYLDVYVEPNKTYDYRLADIDYNGIITYHTIRTITVDQVPLTSAIKEFTVLPAYPNPFNPSTTLRYGLDSDSYVIITIYDITGQLITTLQNTQQIKGWHSVVWNGTNLHGELVPAGLYISRITSDNNVRATKLMFFK